MPRAVPPRSPPPWPCDFAAMWTHKLKLTAEVVRLQFKDPGQADAIRVALLDAKPLRRKKSAVVWDEVVWVADGGYFPWASKQATMRTAIQWFAPILENKAFLPVGSLPLCDHVRTCP